MKKNIRLNHSHILFEDENYIILNKESAWDKKQVRTSLISFLKNRDKLNSNIHLEIHDSFNIRSTGILVFTKNKDATKFYKKSLLNKEIKFDYDKTINHFKSIEFFDKFSKTKINISSNKIKSFKTNKLQYVLFYKPYGVLCQFTKDTPEQKSLADFNLPKDIYPAGRLDKDSEGLLLLSNDGPLIDRITSPKNEKSKTYLVQVEGIPSESSLDKMRKGLIIQKKKTLPCEVSLLKDFSMPPRNPPIRERKNIPTSWIKVILKEGRNRQVRRMTAAIGHPTLRLVRSKILSLDLSNLKEGEFLIINKEDIVL
jgi:23S rRNA pseudouridine2457 synthase